MMTEHHKPPKQQ